MDRYPGPADKVYSTPNSGERVFLHDAVGYWGGWLSRLDSTARYDNGRYTPYAAASVHGWLHYENGRKPIQHYAVNKSCWASGGFKANTTGIAFENASWDLANTPDWYHPLPQSDWQVECSARIIRDLSQFYNRPLSYWKRPTSPTDMNATLMLHKETIRFGHPSTSCDNYRVRWGDIIALLEGQEENEMNDADWKRMSKLIDTRVGVMLGIRKADGSKLPRGKDADGRDKTHANYISWEDFSNENWGHVFTIIKAPNSNVRYIFNGASKEKISAAAWTAMTTNLTDKGSGKKVQMQVRTLSRNVIDAIPDHATGEPGGDHHVVINVVD